MGDADVGQPLFYHYCTAGSLHDVNEVYVPITHFPHLHGMPKHLL